VTDDDWSGTVEMLLGLDADPYSYDDITDNPWSFKIKNRGKENEYTHLSTFGIRLSCLRKYFQELPPNSDDDTVQRSFPAGSSAGADRLPADIDLP
jgi:hypothetical protein